MLRKSRKIRKKYRFKPNISFLLWCQFIIIFIAGLVLPGFKVPRKTYFSIGNHFDRAEKIECSIILNQDTILHQPIKPHSSFHFSKAIPEGRYLIKVGNLSNGVWQADTLIVRDQYLDEYVHIEYQYWTLIKSDSLFPPTNRKFKTEFYHSNFFNYLWIAGR
jgi:hypothetical protein